MAYVCDRCKREMDTNKNSNLAGEEFELCTSCAEYIANHIRRYRPKGFMQNLFGK